MFFLLITLIFLLSCRLFYLFLGTVGDRVLTAPSLNASLIFLHSSLSLSPLSLSVLALSSPFRCVLRKVEKHLWEVMDVTATEVYEVVEDDKDSGPIAEWNMYYRRLTVTSMEKAREDAKAEQIDAMEADEEIMESPWRKQMRGKAFESQQKQAEGMKKRARKVDGKVKEGNIVQIGLSTVDSMKVDSKKSHACGG